jgi:transcription antitermination factor NusG
METLDTSNTSVEVRKEACSQHWYAVRTKSHCECKTEKYLSTRVLETYVPIQEEMHQWSDRRKKIQRIVIPSIIFIKAEDKCIMSIPKTNFFHGFLCSDRKNSIPSIIPDKEIETFRFMLEHSENPVHIEQQKMHTGAKVRVIKGRLKGLCGYITRLKDDSTSISISLGILGNAITILERCDVEMMES